MARLNDATRKALAQADLQKLWAEQGYVAWTGTPDLLAKRAAAEREMWSPVTKGITLD